MAPPIAIDTTWTLDCRTFDLVFEFWYQHVLNAFMSVHSGDLWGRCWPEVVCLLAPFLPGLL